MNRLLTTTACALAVALAGCGGGGDDGLHTPLRPVDFRLPPSTVEATVAGSRTGLTTTYRFNGDTLLERLTVTNIADKVVRDERYDYRGRRLLAVTIGDTLQMEAHYDDLGRLAALEGDTRVIRYCYNTERPLRLDTIKQYSAAHGRRAAEPFQRTDFSYNNEGNRLSGVWQRDFLTNTVHATILKSDGHTDSLRRHYFAGRVNTKLQSGKAGNTVLHSKPVTDPASGERYYTVLTERRGKKTIDKTTITASTTASQTASPLPPPEGGGEGASTASTPPIGGVGGGILLFGILLFVLLTWWLIRFADRRWGLMANFWGPRVPYGKMPRLWMFNVQPYVKMAGITALIILAFLITLGLFQLVGYGMAALIWVMKAASMVILAPAALLASGWVVALLLYLFSSTVRVIINKYIIWLLKLSPIILLGGICAAYEDEVTKYGDRVASWCVDMLGGWTLQEFARHWHVALAAVLAPAALFLAIALLTVVLTLLLMGAEWVMMKAYRVHLRCPHCGGDDHEWLHADGTAHPVPLHPGVYGVFRHRLRGESLPTMLMGGKARLPRRCRACGSVTRAGQTAVNAFGTDVHIGFVGGPMTGKSWLMYEGLYRLIAANPSTMRQHDATHSTSIAAHHNMIVARRDFQTDATRLTHAVQVMVDRRGQPVPWHTHWWDVAGENFDSARQATDMDFYRNVRVVALVIDPLLTVVPAGAGDDFRRWIAAQGRRYSARYDAERAVTALEGILSQAGNNPRRVSVIVVLAKADVGYLRDVAGIDYNTATSQQLHDFALRHMGLHNLDAVLRTSFAGVEYAAVSATDASSPALTRLFERLLRLAGI